MLSEGIVKRLTLAKYLFNLASDHGGLRRGVAGYACVNILQDALEVFLLAAAEHVGAAIGTRTDFPQYLDLINAKLTPAELPFRARLLEINRVRNNSKHHAIAPHPTELTGYIKNAREFLAEASTQIFAKEFWTVSLVQLLDEGEKKQLLTEAENSFEDRRYADCLVACRKAFFIQYEHSYDCSNPLMLSPKVPNHVRSKEWRAANVKDPFDNIVLDRLRIDADLASEGIDNAVWWNIHRLTPDVYRRRFKDPWAVKQDPNKMEGDGIDLRAAYVFENTVDIILKSEANRRAMRQIDLSSTYLLKLSRTAVPVYKKADRNSEVVGETPEDATEVVADYATTGLNDQNTYWKIWFKKGSSDQADHIQGYVLDSDVLLEW